MSGKRNFLLFLGLIIVVSLSAGGSYYYVAQQYDKRLNAKTGDIARLQEINGRLNKQLEDTPVREVVLGDLKFFVPKEWKMEEGKNSFQFYTMEKPELAPQKGEIDLTAGVFEKKPDYTEVEKLFADAGFNASPTKIKDIVNASNITWEISERCYNENTLFSSCGHSAISKINNKYYLISVSSRTRPELTVMGYLLEAVVKASKLTK